MELLNDYDVTIEYHSSKASMAEDHWIACLSVSHRPLAKKIQILASKFMKLSISKRGGLLASIQLRDTFMQDIKAKQFEGDN